MNHTYPETFLGSSQKLVFPLGLGARALSDHRLDEKSVDTIISTFIDHCGNFIDTADVYSSSHHDIGQNERIISNSLSRLGVDKTNMLIATKGGYQRPSIDSWELCNDPKYIRSSCENSLRRLGLDTIPLYFLHGVLPEANIEALSDMLNELRHEQKIGFIGLSNINLDQLRSFQQYITIDAVQNRYNLLYKRDKHNGLLDFCYRHKISYIASTPICGHVGQLSLFKEPIIQHLSMLYNISPHQTILSYMIHHRNVIPIPGASTAEQVFINMNSINIRMSTTHAEMLYHIPDNEDND